MADCLVPVISDNYDNRSDNESQLHAVISDVVKKLGYLAVKDLQLQVISEVIRGHDEFAVLPTIYGKSLCYGCLPQVFDELYHPELPSIVCIISPLIAIIEDQVAI